MQRGAVNQHRTGTGYTFVLSVSGSFIGAWMSRYPARISLGERMRRRWFPSFKPKEDLRTLAQLLRL
ncbi:protein of unknown function [Hyphomicrobium sp. MC1]|nr:protein of unknown function [Hyphomicrobium sp. MC1]